MIAAELRLDSDSVATPRPIDEVAKMFGISRRTMYRLVDELKLTKHRMPGGGKMTYLDPDEVRRKRRPKPVEERGDADPN